MRGTLSGERRRVTASRQDIGKKSLAESLRVALIHRLVVLIFNVRRPNSLAGSSERRNV